ncbi:MAG: hypothetical protein ABT01_04140 [Clostridium sp. SCN 57-10]|nr:MAG: hypothetical protein ABT01_04140 [Clostridium sp. SCN 57-10]
MKEGTMVSLREVDEHNWPAAAALRVGDEQRGFVAPAMGILGRAYAYRRCRAAIYAVYRTETMVGLMMVRDLDEDPACYELQQFMIDCRYQGTGCGQSALRQLMQLLTQEKKYPVVEVCVNREDAAALHVYQKVGFVHSGYVDENLPECVHLVYTL